MKLSSWDMQDVAFSVFICSFALLVLCGVALLIKLLFMNWNGPDCAKCKCLVGDPAPIVEKIR